MAVKVDKVLPRLTVNQVLEERAGSNPVDRPKLVVDKLTWCMWQTGNALACGASQCGFESRHAPSFH